ncbi:MAG: HAMP domain-containing histidine kinase [Sphingomonadales bacterium]|nr:MAG: HAMP domain-containing histidine kinase [Sphingomonadales bacterium]
MNRAKSSVHILLQRGSLSRRILALAIGFLLPVLLGGGLALDRVLANALTQAFDEQLQDALASLMGAADLQPDGSVQLQRPLADQRFAEPYSGKYWQISTVGAPPLRSRSLWDRALATELADVRFREPARRIATLGDERLRLLEQDAVLAGSRRVYRFVVAVDAARLEAQIAGYRRVLLWSVAALGVAMLLLVGLLAAYGLWPLRRIREGIVAVRAGASKRMSGGFPPEVQPLVDELNALLDHTDAQADEARTHAGNLAHALKTPMTVLLNEASAGGTPLAATVTSEVMRMKRHVDHHLARARALGRRAALGARTKVWPSLESLQRAMTRIYAERGVAVALSGDQTLAYRGERQDLEEMLGNLMDNACKYGGGRVRVSIERDVSAPSTLALLIEDNGPGLTPEQQARVFQRGERLDQQQPGSGIGLAIVRDLAALCGGGVTLGASAALGGLSVCLRLPAAD